MRGSRVAYVVAKWLPSASDIRDTANARISWHWSAVAEVENFATGVGVLASRLQRAAVGFDHLPDIAVAFDQD